jgi:predicted metal-dependent enzyme (double-stranded beta helix superfamily)
MGGINKLQLDPDIDDIDTILETMSNEYAIKDFVDDVMKVISETEDEELIISKVSPLAIRAAAGMGWRRSEMYSADPELGFGTTLLHAESDNSLFICVDSWLPGRGVRPHEHGTWAVVLGVTGVEVNTNWERIDDGSVEGHAELRKVNEQSISAGEVITMKTGAIHSVKNPTKETTLSFHVYGHHLNHTGRSQFDVQNNREIPFLIQMR